MSENQNKVNETQVKKVQELLGSQEFVKELTNTATIEEAQELFKSRGVETTEDELKMLGNLINKIRENKGELSQDELDSAVGGGVSSVAKKAEGVFIGGLGGLLGGGLVGAGVGVGTAATMDYITDKTGFGLGGPATKQDVSNAIIGLGSLIGLVRGIKKLLNGQANKRPVCEILNLHIYNKKSLPHG